MVAETATTQISLLRGTVIDPYGDTQDAGMIIATGVPALLIETARTAWDPASQAPRTVRVTECHLPQWAGVVTTDQIYDELSQQTYMIESIEQPPALTGAQTDTRLTLRRVTGTST